MRDVRPFLPVVLAAALLAPSSTLAQDRRIAQPCDVDCWWPAGPVAQLDRVDATVDVEGAAIVARYRFELSNPGSLGPDGAGDLAEGRIVFPVPDGSSVTDLVLSGGPETLEGRVLGADDALRIYEDIVSRMIDPALLRSLDDDLYEVRAFPVPIGEERQVSFTVTTPLLAEGDQAIVEVPWSGMSPRPASASVDVDVDVPWEVRSALAPGFDLGVGRDGPGSLRLGWESGADWTPDTSFRLYLGGGDGLVATQLLAHRAGDDDGYFALLFAPALEPAGVVARDIVLVIDVSGSMEGEKLEQAKAAAAYVLGHLGAQDRFAIVDFSSTVQTFSDELRPAEDAPAGVEYVNDLVSAGNTNISGALQTGLGLLTGERPGTVIFLTDGLPTTGIENTDGILDLARQSASARTQLFAFGVGYDVDTVLLDALAGDFVGTSHYVTPDERIDTEVQRLYERVSTPVLTDISVTIEGVETSDMAPGALTGLFAGSQALLTGRYAGSGPATVVVTGTSERGVEHFSYEVDFPGTDTTDPSVAQLWAQRRVADLLTEVRVEGMRDSLIEDIVDIATRFGIVTPYTSYLAEEPDLAFERGAALDEVQGRMQSAPSSGQDAVVTAEAVERLRDGVLDAGGAEIRVVGAHAYYRLEDAWARDGYEPGTSAPEVVVGSDAFRALIASDPELATAAALGERVIVEGPDGWVTIVWPEIPAG